LHDGQSLGLIHAEPFCGGQLLQGGIEAGDVRAVGNHQNRDADDVGQIRRIEIGAQEIFLSHRPRHRFGELPILQNCLADRRVPIVDDVIQHRLARKQFRVIGGARQDVQLADAVHHAGEHCLVRVDPGASSRQHVGICGHVSTAFPKIVQMRRQRRQLVGFADLIHCERHRGAAHHVVADASDGGSQVGDAFAAAVDRRGIRDAQQPGRQRRFRSHDAHNLFDPGIWIGQDPPDLQRYFRERR